VAGAAPYVAGVRAAGVCELWDGWCGLPVMPCFLGDKNPSKSLALGS
jgi:hypothetical protein